MIKKLSKVRCLKTDYISLAKIEVINNRLKQMIPEKDTERNCSKDWFSNLQNRRNDAID